MKKYYFKGTNQEVKLGDKFTTIITCSNGKQYRNNGTVDESTIKDLLDRDSIEAKEIVPVQKKINKILHKKGFLSKEPDIKVISINNEDEFKKFLNIVTDILSGKY